MAEATATVLFTVTAPTQQEANAKLKQGTLDFLKQNLGSLNAELLRRGQQATTLEGIDAATNQTLGTWLTLVIRLFASDSVRAWRVAQADEQHVKPVRGAAADYNEVI
jgi:hypothetical protein